METIIIFGTLLLLLITGVPIAVCLGLSSMIYIFFFTEMPRMAVAQKIFTGLDSFPLMAIPFFVLASNFLSTGQVAARMIRFANSLVGWVRGGLPMAGILSCIFFAAASGSSPATVVAIGSIMIPALVRNGYDIRFATGVMACSGSLGILIPPSIIMIIYGVSTGQSIGKLFIAGIAPGLLLGLMLMAVTYFVVRTKKLGNPQKFSWKEFFDSGKDAVWGLLLVVIVIGGIYTGIFTPTEAAAVSAVYAFVIAIFVHREMKWRDAPAVLRESAGMTSMLFFIIANAMLFAFVLTAENIPHRFAQWVIANDFSPWSFLLMVNAVLWFAGDFMEPSSVVLILAPIFLPLLEQLKIDPIHFGIIMTMNMEVGMITPPVGLNLYVAAGISGLGLTAVMRAALPWMLVMIAALFIVTYVPWISLFLVNFLY
ncbi:MAG: C4-dicarboxylate TRAP transporter large permease protein DctM [bacterium]|nr:MAG: C4-dicarboxylate TRAP transporter large permease protein DctM [bacterium]